MPHLCRSRCGAFSVENIAENYPGSIIAVGGQTEIPVFSELLAGLMIPTFAVVDEDPNNLASAAVRQRIAQHLPAANILLQRPNLETMWNLPIQVGFCSNLFELRRVMKFVTGGLLSEPS